MAQQSSIAIDAPTGVVYAVAREGGFLTESNLSSGALLASNVIDPNPLPGIAAWVGICLAPAVGRLFLSFQSPGGGSVWVVNATDLSLLSVVRNFPGEPNFEPGAIICDAGSGTVVVQGTTDGAVYLFNATTLATGSVLYPCSSACAPDGLVDVPTYGYLVPLEGGNSTRVIVPGLVALGPTLFAPSAQFSMGAGVYDPADNAVWIANRSLPTSTDLALFDAPGRSYLASIHSPGLVAALAFAPEKNAVLLADSVPSGPPDRLDWLNASTGAVLANDSGSHPPGPAARAITALAYGARAGSAFLLASDAASVELFELAPLGPPEFLFLRALANVPTEHALATNSVDGSVYLLQSFVADPASPGALVAVNGSSGNLSWSIPVSGFSRASGAIAVDPVLHLLFVADTAGGVTMVDSGNGSLLGTLTTPHGTVGVTVDATRGLLDVLAQSASNNATNVSVFALGPGGPHPLGGFALLGLPVCAWVADPPLGALAVVGCQGGPGLDLVSWFSELNGSARRSVATGTVPSGVTADRVGNLYVANLGTGNVTIVNVSGPSIRSVPTGVVEPVVLAVDATAQLLFVSGPFAAAVAIDSASTGRSLGSFALPSSVGGLVVNPGTGEVVATAYLTGQLLLAPLLPAPSQVGGVSVLASNGSLSVTWAPALGVSGYPVTNYSVHLSSSGSGGPWVLASIVNATTANLTGLADGTTYFVEVAASAATGTGSPSSAVPATPVGKPYPPTALAVLPRSATSLNVTWGAPISTGGSNLTGFILGWALDAIGPWVNVSEPASPYSAILGGLAPNTGYFVRVSAESIVGVGNPSTAVSTQTPSSSGTGPHGSATLSNPELLALGVGAVAVALAAFYLYRIRKRPGPP
ncbi:MAG: fibronectin type III domain-containing protein [Thermoplasmata archaeon]|nr:fibronectin type III domain-containing protein [Thermoplasmata archaeon]